RQRIRSAGPALVHQDHVHLRPQRLHPAVGGAYHRRTALTRSAGEQEQSVFAARFRGAQHNEIDRNPSSTFDRSILRYRQRSALGGDSATARRARMELERVGLEGRAERARWIWKIPSDDDNDD